jgi:hypothetical protein
MEYFISFNIFFITRDKNQKAGSLALEASLSNPYDIQRKTYLQVERVFRPSVPNNLEYFQVFENYEQLEILLLNDDDDDEDNHMYAFPKDCIQYESLFMKYDHAKNLLEEISLRKVQETRSILELIVPKNMLTWELIAPLRKLINMFHFLKNILMFLYGPMMI